MRGFSSAAPDVTQFLVKSPKAAIRELLEPGNLLERDPAVRPLVTLYDRHGHSFHGRLISAHAGHLLLLVTDPRGEPQDSVIYIPDDSVVSLQLHQASRYARQLASTQMSPDTGGKTEHATPVNLERLVEETTARVNAGLGASTRWSVEWDSFEHSDRASINLRDLIADIGAILTGLLREEMEKQAWAEVRELTIRSQADMGLKVNRRDDTVRIQVDLERGTHSWTRDLLERELNHVL